MSLLFDKQLTKKYVFYLLKIFLETALETQANDTNEIKNLQCFVFFFFYFSRKIIKNTQRTRHILKNEPCVCELWLKV